MIRGMMKTTIFWNVTLLKHWQINTKLQGVTSQRTLICEVIAMRTSNLTDNTVTYFDLSGSSVLENLGHFG